MSARRFRLGVGTAASYASLTDEDRALVRALAARGVDAGPVVWSEALPAGLDGVVLRSCWDYHLASGAFRRFVRACEVSGPRLANTAATVLWNIHKGYLLDLQARGVAIPETAVIGPDGTRRGAAIDHDGSVVVKPAVSMSGWETHRFDRGHARDVEAAIDRLRAHGDVLVQAYRAEIQQGEVSLVVLAGKLSHAVLKRPAAGEFRVQEELGGTREAYEAGPALALEAERIAALCPEPPLIARVDGVLDRGRFVLMELEAIDPVLFAGSAAGATERIADAIFGWLHC